MWDLYTSDRKLTGETHQRGIPMPKDRYHLVVHLWIFDTNGNMLIQKRGANVKSKPGIWSMTGGSATIGEHSELAMMREAEEEIGLHFTNEVERWVVASYLSGPSIVDIWAAILQDGHYDASSFKISEEVDAVKWVSQHEFQQMLQTPETGEFSKHYMNKLFGDMRISGLRV